MRIFRLASILLAVSFITFLLLDFVPGDAAELLLRSEMQTASPERAAALRQELGLDAPLPLRWLRWLGRAAVLDFGTSFRSGEQVSRELLRRLPTTLTLACCAFCFTVSIAMASALLQNRLPDKAHRLWTVLAVSVPDYWVGLMLLLIFALKLRWLPVAGGSGLKMYILPTLALSLSASAAEGRIFRASIIEVLNQDWVLFARAKGLSQMQVFFGHVFKPALLSMLSVWGMLLGHLLGGAVVVESVFSLPGLGKLAADAVLQRDMPMVQGTVLLITFFFVIASFVVETARAALVPFRHEGA